MSLNARVLRRLFLAGFVLVLSAKGSLAVDGVVEINAARASVGGVSPGDTPGLPVTISQPGSYVLTGSLELSAPGTTIVVSADDVSIDLNGFSLVCVNAGTGCGTGYGIDARGRDGLSVRDGFITGFGDAGIAAEQRTQVTSIDVSENPGFGLLITECVVSDVIAWGNGRDGILASDCTINTSVVAHNGASGMTLGHGVVSESVARFNTTLGIGIQAGTIHSSVAFDNTADGFVVVSDGLISGSAAAGNGGFGLRGPPIGLQGGCTERIGYAHNAFGANAGVPSNGDQVVGCVTQMDLNSCSGSIICP